jgi:drug/metabolite transporter (DMT)-like permease
MATGDCGGCSQPPPAAPVDLSKRKSFRSGRGSSRGRCRFREVLGLCGYYLASILDLAGLRYVSAGLERLILYVYPTLVLLFGRLLFGRRIRRAEFIAMAVSYAGLLLVFAEDVRLYEDGVVIGGALVLGSAAAYALFILGSGRLIPAIGAMRFTCYAMSAAGIGIGAHFALAQPANLLTLPMPVYGWGVVLALGCTVLPSFLLAAGIARVGAERAALVGLIGPVSTIAVAHLALGEPVTAVHLLGGGLILLGVLSLTLGKTPAPAPVAAHKAA